MTEDRPELEELEEALVIEQSHRPDMSYLDAAVDPETGDFKAKVGDSIVIEMTSDSGAWLWTRTVELKGVDAASGNFWAWDHDLEQSAGGNFKTAEKMGIGLRLTTCSGGIVPTKKMHAKKKRGRPKGSKNKCKTFAQMKSGAKR